MSNACEAYLDALSSLNDGPDHATSYLLDELFPAEDLRLALRTYVSRQYEQREAVAAKMGKTFIRPEFSVDLIEITDDWKQDLRASTSHWFFGQQHSPTIEFEYARTNTVAGFMKLLEKLVGDAKAYKVDFTGAMLPFEGWEGFAFSNAGRHWLLQFGWSD